MGCALRRCERQMSVSTYEDDRASRTRGGDGTILPNIFRAYKTLWRTAFHVGLGRSWKTRSGNRPTLAIVMNKPLERGGRGFSMLCSRKEHP